VPAVNARVVTATALGLAGCGFHIGASSSDASTGDAVDAANRDGDPDAAIDGPRGMGPWGAPVLVPIPGSASGDDDPTLTDDRLEMYFNRLADIYVTRRASVSAPWGTPALVTELSSAGIETTPEITSDGLTIFIASDRLGSSLGSGDIWMSTRATRTSPWGVPVNVAAVNSAETESASAVTDDLKAMVLLSTRDTVLADLYIATRSASNVAWNTPVAIAAINTAGSDYSPILTQDKLRIYWDSDGGSASEDLYTASRSSTSGTFGTPVNITELNSSAVEADPWISADEHHIVFVSNRSGVFQMYEASR
jgi:hypothetical protein